MNKTEFVIKSLPTKSRKQKKKASHTDQKFIPKLYEELLEPKKKRTSQ